MSNRARVKVDFDKCTGHGRCYSIAPQIFDRGDDDLPVIREETIDESQRALLDRAIKLCPELAISVEEE